MVECAERAYTVVDPPTESDCEDPTMALRAAASRLALNNLGGAVVARRPAAGRASMNLFITRANPVVAASPISPFSSDSLKRSPHVALEEKGLLVERLLQAKVRGLRLGFSLHAPMGRVYRSHMYNSSIYWFHWIEPAQQGGK